MDDQRFDNLARALSAGVSRRRTVRLFAATAVASWSAWMGRSAIAQPDSACSDPALSYCAAVDVCVDLFTDINNCGACGSVCGSGLVPVACRGGACVRASCPEGIEYCGAVDGCRDLATDPSHCGGCGNGCESGTCNGGVCGPLAAPPLVPLGGICQTSDQCQRDGMSTVICGDNGIAPDGDLNCCAERGCCSTDADCCGDQRCAPTGDVCSVCLLPPFPTSFLGEPCTTDDNCVPSVVATVTCVAGVCTAPGIDPPPMNRDRLDPEAAMAAAEEYSRLEAVGAFDALYDQMHPDARAVIPRPAVVGWYENAFAPREPAPATAIKVRFIQWTWPVTAVTYENPAEVTYRQRFGNGPEEREVVRLVRDTSGAWRWFFGRTPEFVDEQINRYADSP